MNINLIKDRYNEAVHCVIKKATELSNIDEFDKQVEILTEQYFKKMDRYINVINDFVGEDNFEELKKKHIGELKKKLFKLEVSSKISDYVDGDIYNHINEIETYLKEGEYTEEIELILSINIFSSFKSVKSISKKKYPCIQKFLSTEKYSIKLEVKCPFCKDENIVKFYKKTKPGRHDLYIENLLKCNCDFPEYWGKSSDYLNQMKQLVNRSEKLISLNLKENDLIQLNYFAKEKFPDFYMFEDEYKTIYEEEKEFEIRYINKVIWAKIKKNDLALGRDEVNILQKISNSIIKGLKICSLNTIIKNLSFNLEGSYSLKNNIRYIDYRAHLKLHVNCFETKYKINSKLIDYIQNYKPKEKKVNEIKEESEIFALGYYCKSQGIKMENLWKYGSLLHFCRENNIELHELQELAVIHKNND